MFGRLARLMARRTPAVLAIVLLAIVFAPAVTVVGGSVSVVISAADAAQITATWTDNASGTAMFKVERKTGTTGTYGQIGTTAMGATSYVDTAVTTGTTYCYRVRASNESGDSGYSNEACLALAGGYEVTVAKSGTGSGTAMSSPNGINCGTDCFESFPAGTVVTLTATPNTGSVFSGWSGGGCTGTSPCVTTGNTPVKITATFSLASQSSPTPPPPTTTSYTLTATKSGTGSGTVVSNPAGINCGSDCAETVAAGTSVTLTATPASGSSFGGWSGSGCSGTGTCTVTVSGNTSVTATFTATTTSATTTTKYRLRIRKTGTGTGTVVSAPAGINCGSDCSQLYPNGQAVTLTATAAAGSTFTGWTGSGCGSTVTMNSNRRCTANFQTALADTPVPTSTTEGPTCPCTIWRASTTPGLVADPDTNAVEVGVKFRSDSPGYITGIRFYKSSANTGTHVGHLWTSTGTLLASVTFSGETSSGWQQASFSRPVPISANTTYIASYHTTVGRYSADVDYFASRGVDTPPLHALSNGAGGNGVYRYGSSGFPNQTYRASNYWVDVVFTLRQ
jgi:hypothetical protein